MQSSPACGRGKKRAEHAETDQEIGVSRGGRNTKIHAIVDALGNPIHLVLTAGNRNDCSVAVDVLSGVTLSGSVVLADKAYGTQAIRDHITSQESTFCIPPKSNVADPWECDFNRYKERHVMEYFFNKLKQFRGIATRYDKLARHFLSFAYLASAMILLK
ncbi:IS5 family transposase [Paenibacillus enshidis]|uniref:IS5 family transposase n=1 Tax=Paenibacillus enshidis TaxID=1458439 RepID=A0ABV5AYB3_9BACL